MTAQDDDSSGSQRQRAFHAGAASGIVRARGRVVPFQSRREGRAMTAAEVLARYAQRIADTVAANLPRAVAHDPAALEPLVTRLVADVAHEVRVGWWTPCPDGPEVARWIETRIAWVLLARVYRARIERTIRQLLPADMTRDVEVCTTTAEILAYRFWERCRLERDGARNAWIRRIATNVARTWIRDPKNTIFTACGTWGMQGEGDEADGLWAEIADADLIPLDARAVTGEEVTLLARAFARLSPERQQAIRLVVLLGRTYPEAAVELGCPEGTVKQRVHRGLRQLRRWLEEYGVRRDADQEDPDDA